MRNKLDLLVTADELSVAIDGSGLPVRDRHALGDGARIVLSGAEGGEITFEGIPPVHAADRYSISPKAKSVRAFARS